MWDDDARSTVYIGVLLRAWIMKGRIIRRGNEILRGAKMDRMSW